MLLVLLFNTFISVTGFGLKNQLHKTAGVAHADIAAGTWCTPDGVHFQDNDIPFGDGGYATPITLHLDVQDFSDVDNLTSPAECGQVVRFRKKDSFRQYTYGVIESSSSPDRLEHLHPGFHRLYMNKDACEFVCQEECDYDSDSCELEFADDAYPHRHALYVYDTEQPGDSCGPAVSSDPRLGATVSRPKARKINVDHNLTAMVSPNNLTESDTSVCHEREGMYVLMRDGYPERQIVVLVDHIDTTSQTDDSTIGDIFQISKGVCEELCQMACEDIVPHRCLIYSIGSPSPAYGVGECKPRASSPYWAKIIPATDKEHAEALSLEHGLSLPNSETDDLPTPPADKRRRLTTRKGLKVKSRRGKKITKRRHSKNRKYPEPK